LITLTRLKGSRIALNPDLIERVEETPDTTVLMIDGATYIVKEHVEEVIDRIVQFRARVLVAATLGTQEK